MMVHTRDCRLRLKVVRPHRTKLSFDMQDTLKHARLQVQLRATPPSLDTHNKPIITPDRQPTITQPASQPTSQPTDAWQ